ncbi:heme A synthase [Pedobacter sp. SYSU D00535]|uniref:COX15/CtaA family protein n=1 Tax=Pedobacter sp. SYSU D00535 TaxID=2810308 RepID=UPI001A9580AE|nr:COX15/CtaA family protein [Pedobacter sp. SYSU D00535]
MYPSSERRFLAANLIAIVALFVLILAGGVVRSTGSGMGCPDWPKCFDQYVPPTHVSQLPEGYQHKFVEGRVKKNERFARSLDLLGFGSLAEKIRNDKSILEPESFNAAKTWTEYVNRLIGALTGLVLLACAVLSLTYIKSKKRIFFLSVFNLFLVVFQAWLGSIVVSTNLLSWVVTIHMLLALAIVGITIYTYFHARILRDRQILANKAPGVIKTLAVVSVGLTVVQIAIGTEVREGIDAIATALDFANRDSWVSQVGFSFSLHRNLSILVLLVNLALLVLMRRKYLGNSHQFKFVSYVVLLIFAQLITGITLSYMALPPVSQALHILLASLAFGAQYYLLLILKQSKLYK